MDISRALSSPLPRRIFATCIFAAIVSGGGCAQNTTTTVAKTNPPGNAAVAGSTPSTPGATWQEALEKWWQAFSQSKTPKQTPGNASGTPPQTKAPTQSEIAAIAARHPAWKLADELEKNRAQSLQFEAVAARAPQTGSTPAAPDFDVAFPAPTNVSDNNSHALPAPALSENAHSEVSPEEDASVDPGFAAPVVITPSAQTLREDARARQENSIAEFLRTAQLRQKNWQRDYRAVLETALGEEIEVAQQRAPSSIALVLPSPELQLEMTNLRLQLLSNVFSTPAEREKAGARLQELMKLWRAALAKQEKIRADELERLRVEEPARLRQVGLQELEAQLETIRRAQQANRDAIAAEHRARLEADFGNENARLVLALPALPAPGVLPVSNIAPSQSVENTGSSFVRPFLEKIVFSRTKIPQRTSVNGFSGVAASQTQMSAARATQIHTLRALAWRDAKRQATMAQRLAH